jgi:serine phosphatase RsbU (regulator of sigma subunit)
MAEVIYATVAVSVFVMAWTLRPFLDDDFAVVLGTGMGAAALLHLLHMVDFPGMDLIGTGYDSPTQVWIAARLLTAVTFMAAALVIGRRVPVRLISVAYLVAVLLVALTIYWWQVFPSMLDEVTGLTPLKIALEYVVIGLFALAMALIWARRSRLPGKVAGWLLAALGAGIAAELFFTLYTGPHTWPNLVGHVFLILSAVLVYMGVIEEGLARPHSLMVAGLREAGELHESLERSLLPTLPVRRDDVSVTLHYRPGERHLELGGDFIDVLDRGDDGLAVICGDVSGHGPDAAAVGAMLRAGWQALVVTGAEAGDVVAGLRALIVRERPHEDLFATLCLVWVDPGRDEVAIINMGHPSPLVIADGVDALVAPPLPPLGSIDVPVPPPLRRTLPPGWQLFFYTDGLIEGRAAPGAGERFGEERLRAALTQLTCAALDDTCLDALLARVEQAGGESFTDDVTVAVLAKRDGGARAATGASDDGAAVRRSPTTSAARVRRP